MKTPEDEAFDELAKKQGAWGGGFQAKRAAAADKQEPAQATVSFPCCGYTDAIKWNQFNGVVQCHMCGQIYTASLTAQPAQEPVAQWQKKHKIETEGKWENTDEFDAKWWRDHSKGWEIRALYTTSAAQPAQPAQEPVAWTLLLTGEHHGIIGEAGEKFIGAPECYQRVNVYTTTPKRPWVGLTAEDKYEFAAAQHSWEDLCLAVEAKLKEKNT